MLAWLILALVFGAAPLALLGACWKRLERHGTVPLVCGGSALAYILDAGRAYAPLAGPWGTLGNSLIELPGVSQLALVGGAPFLSGLLVATNLTLARAWTTWGRERAPVGLAVGLLVAIGYLTVQWAGSHLGPSPEGSKQRLKVLVVQTAIPYDSRWAHTAQRTNLRAVRFQTERALDELDESPDLVVWPEMVATSPIDSDPALMREVLEISRHLNLPVVLGVARSNDLPDAPGDYRNSAVWLSPRNGIESVVDKQVAIPLIESSRSFPGAAAILSLFGSNAWGSQRVSERSSPGQLSGNVELVIAICYEIQFPWLVERRYGAGAFAIVNVSSDGWMESETLSESLLVFARLRAIENRSFVVRATDSGVSAVIDPWGRVLGEVPFGERGTIHAEIFASPGASDRERLRLVGVLIGSVAVGLILVEVAWRFLR